MRRSYGQGDEIESWAEKHSLTCLIIRKPTHWAVNTPDLAWNSDHLPIRGIVPVNFQDPALIPSPIRVTNKILDMFLRTVSQRVVLPSSFKSLEGIEVYAKKFAHSYQVPSESRVEHVGGRLASWWTTDCKRARTEY